MSRLGKMEAERYGGARWALERINAIGLEEAKKEFEWRGIQNAPLNIETAEIKRYETELKDNCKKTMAAMCCLVLHDEFGFGHDRIEKFIKRWNRKVDCLEEDMTLWPAYTQILKDECGIDVELPVCYMEGTGNE